jgi:hypothetical protein
MDHERTAQNDDEMRRREEMTEESATPTTADNPRLNEGGLSPTGPLGGSPSMTGGLSSGGSMGGGAMAGPLGEGPDPVASPLDSDLGPTGEEHDSNA